MEAKLLEMYPRDAHGFIRQCAWCRRVADRSGTYRLHSKQIISSASHGCCDLCAALFVGQVMPGEMRRAA